MVTLPGIGTIVCVTDGTAKYGLCLHGAISSDYTDEWLGRAPDNDRPDGLRASDDEQRSMLSTGPDFGCIHFEINPQ